MKKPTLFDRIRYAFDNSLSHGAWPLMGWLAIASVVLVICSALLLSLLGVSPVGHFADLVWLLTLHTLGKSVPNSDGASWLYLILMLLIGFAGVFITGTLVAVLTEMVRSKIADLREGRSRVIESGHTVILGWSPHTLVILRELLTAKGSEADSCVVVLADRDKAEMDDDIHKALPRHLKTRIVCRRGSPSNPADLATANPAQAHSIIIASPEGDDPDSEVIRILLAVKLCTRDEPMHAYIVAEIKRSWNINVARLAAPGQVEVLWAGDLISRMTAQACREPGLSEVYTELLDFEGDEIYFRVEPSLVGKTFAQALSAYDTSTPIGILPQGAQPLLRPPMDTVLHEGDSLILIAEDDSSIRLSDRKEWDIRSDLTVNTRNSTRTPERILILGWNSLGASIINELDSYAAPGSVVSVVSDLPSTRTELRRQCSSLVNQTVRFRSGNTSDREKLEELGIAGYNHVVVLCYCDSLDRQAADARTLVTLLHLREFAEKAGHPFSIVTEILDVRNRDLAASARADDLIVSEQYISLALAQISERRELATVFADLFNPEGSEIHMRAAGDYVVLGQPVDFYTVLDAARALGEVALGYRQAARADSSRGAGLELNPVKSALVTFAEADRIIILADA